MGDMATFGARGLVETALVAGALYHLHQLDCPRYDLWWKIMHGDEEGRDEGCGSAVGAGVAIKWMSEAKAVFVNPHSKKEKFGVGSYAEHPAQGSVIVPRVTAPLGDVIGKRGHKVVEQLPCRLAFGLVDDPQVIPFVVQKELRLHLFEWWETKGPRGSNQSGSGYARGLLGGKSSLTLGERIVGWAMGFVVFGDWFATVRVASQSCTCAQFCPTSQYS